MSGTNAAQVGVVIVTYNSAAHIVEALRSLEMAATTPPHVVLVDNASSDDTLELVRATAPTATIIPSGINLGFARACNLGAANVGAEFLLFLNPDSVLDPGSLDLAVSRLSSDPSIGMVGARTRYGDGSLNPTCCFAEPSLWSAFCHAVGLTTVFPRSGVFNPDAIGGWDRDSDRDVDVITGCFLLIATERFRVLGGWDERFFLYSEDTDLGARMRASGLRCVHLHDVGLVHYGGGSDVVRAEKLLKVYRARVQFFEKHWSPARAQLGAMLVKLAVLVRFLCTRLGPAPARAKWGDVWRSRDMLGMQDTQEEGGNGMGSDVSGVPSDKQVVMPPVPINPREIEMRARMVYRTGRHTLRSVRSGDYDFALQGLRTEFRLPVLFIGDLASRRVRHGCNICGWQGRKFYPNTGPGYHDMVVMCPGCGCLDRHRSLLALLLNQTKIFDGAQKVVEVAPMRGFQTMMRSQPDLDYTSFDLERHAMERGDITAMRYSGDSLDYFLCFHVLEHIPDDVAAIKEIHRVLKPGGTAVLQVPLDWDVARTREYDAPDPREVGHVRRYGRDFGDRLGQVGLQVRYVSVGEVLSPETIEWFGLSPEPIFFAQKPNRV